MRRGLLSAVILGVAITGLRAETGPMSRPEAFRRARLLSAIGREAFRDPGLSASGKLACASCHDPAHAFGPPDSRAVEFGGSAMGRPGLRAVPSLTYIQASPPFTEHYFDADDEGDESIDNGPTGGLTWDGRVDRGAEQARIPLLSPFEMANTGAEQIAAKAAAAPYAPALREAFGADLFAHPDRAFAAVAKSLEVYEQEAAEFYPYSSKYDAFLAGRVALTRQETRGLALFDDPAKGNCAKCHISAPRRRRHPATVHRLRFRRAGGAAQHLDPGQRRPAPGSTSACAARCAPTSPTAPPIAACFARRACAM